MPLTLKKIDYSYNAGTSLETAALSDIDLTVEPGEFIGLTGPTGSGKSTLLQMAAGLLKPTRGTVSADGLAGMVFQNPDHQLFETTLEREIAFAPECQKLSEAEIRERVDEALRLTGLDAPEMRSRSPFTLSGGEKRRAVLAGILAMKPKYLLLDEPLAGLDAKGAEMLLDCLHERCNAGTAVVIAAHDPDVICEHADRLIRMDRGRILFDGTVEEALDDQNNPDLPPDEFGQVRETLLRLRAGGIVLPGQIRRFSDLAEALRAVLKERREND